MNEEKTTADRQIATSRVIDAPRARIFEAFTDPKRLVNWWGPKGFTNTFHEINVKPGGAWKFVMHGPDGGNYDNESVFVEVVKPERMVIRHLSAPHFVLSITLAEQAGKTKLTWSMLFDTVEDCDKVKRIVVEANEQNLDRLEAELARMT